jgi:hypothetical protein
MTQHAVANIDGSRVLAQLPMRPVFWMPRELAECVGHRYTIKPPSVDSAHDMAVMQGGGVITI